MRRSSRANRSKPRGDRLPSLRPLKPLLPGTATTGQKMSQANLRRPQMFFSSPNNDTRDRAADPLLPSRCNPPPSTRTGAEIMLGAAETHFLQQLFVAARPAECKAAPGKNATNSPALGYRSSIDQRRLEHYRRGWNSRVDRPPRVGATGDARIEYCARQDSNLRPPV